MAQKFTLNVNGKDHTIEAEPDMPLLYALRDDLGMNNPRFGCGLAQCGACTVHLNGVPVRSCVTPMSRREGRQVNHPQRPRHAGEAAPMQHRLHRGTGAAMRLLPQRLGHDLRGAAGEEPQPTDDEIREALRAEVPLRHPHRHPARRQARRHMA